MKTKAAVLHGVGRDWEVVELDLDEPRHGEVLVRWVASGMCHSDEHIRDGAETARLPFAGGHEGAGIVEAVGPDVSRVKVGDHIIGSFVPVCGHCRWCARGKSYLCDNTAFVMDGIPRDGKVHFRGNGLEYGTYAFLATFSQFSVVYESACVVIDKDIPLEQAALLGCGAPTGWGSAVNAGHVQPGDTTVIYGVGGLGHYAVQGAVHAGAQYIVAVDPVEFKRDSASRLGATHAVATAEEADQLVKQLTHGVGADQAIITVGEADTAVVRSAFSIIGKGSTMVLTSISDEKTDNVVLPGLEMTNWNKRVQGALYGQCNPFETIPRLVRMWHTGQLKIEETITRQYKLEDINEGYRAMHDGENVRGVILHDR